MANMGYCRFSNTLHDLRDCYEHMDDEDLSDSESEARERLIEVCREIAGEIKNKQEPHKMAEFVTQTGQLNERLTIKTPPAIEFFFSDEAGSKKSYGKLFVKDGVLTFEGDAEKSAKLFFEYVISLQSRMIPIDEIKPLVADLRTDDELKKCVLMGAPWLREATNSAKAIKRLRELAREGGE